MYPPKNSNGTDLPRFSQLPNGLVFGSWVTVFRGVELGELFATKMTTSGILDRRE
jgi:hypothetical protein